MSAHHLELLRGIHQRILSILSTALAGSRRSLEPPPALIAAASP
jgi:hypothetical protein